MSELVGGKCGRTPAVGSAVPCGSASPVCYLISVLGAARRFACENRREPDLGFRCGSASPVCYLISVLGAARRCQWLRWICVGFRCSVRLGVAWASSVTGFRCGSVSLGCLLSLDLDAARRRLGVFCTLKESIIDPPRGRNRLSFRPAY